MINIELFNDDCLNIMKKLSNENKKFELILTDIPYNVSRKNNFHTVGRRGIDLGEWDKNFNFLEWLDYVPNLITKNGSVLIFCSLQQISFIIEALEKLNFVFKDCIVWLKSNPMPRNVERRYVPSNEYVLWFVKKGAKWTFNKPNEYKYLKQMIKNSKCSGNERTEHITQKPLKVIEFLINLHSNENDTVFDPFMGSGTTGVACKNLNRSFIGVEIDEKYFGITKKRIEDEKKASRK